jgi:hypothetical protein
LRWSVALFSLLLSGCATLAPLEPGTIAFAVLGDTPYSEGQAQRLDAAIRDINSQNLAFVVHVGDVGTSAQACTDDWLLARKRQFARVQHPFVLLPGDNEWSDCRGRDPMERLRNWRSIFCRSLPFSLPHATQTGEYCEHLRWQVGGTLFVSLNVPGNANNARHPEHAARMRAVLAWLDEAEALQPERIVILMQANPFVPRAAGYSALIERLGQMAAKRPGRVVLAHGDTHIAKDDEPLPGLRRIEVWGSPFVSWTRASIVGKELRVSGAGQY